MINRVGSAMKGSLVLETSVVCLHVHFVWQEAGFRCQKLESLSDAAPRGI